MGVADADEPTKIKVAYFKLAQKFHPDKIKDDKKKEAAEEKFKDIANAYEILKDKETRNIYDLKKK